MTLGIAGILGLTCVAVATGLAASPPASAGGTAAKAPRPGATNSPPRVADGVTAAVPGGPVSRPTENDPIVSPTLSTPAFQARTANLVTPEALQRLVSLRTARPPRPVGQATECMARAVYHEAANQALPGQLAVAQVILNRIDGGPAFAKSVCGVVNQSGQFSQIHGFEAPSSDIAHWRIAVAIAFIAQERRLSQVAPGALFFHAAYVLPAWSHSRQRIARIGDQVFYR